MDRFGWWPNDDDAPQTRGDDPGIPAAHPGGKISWRGDKLSDLSRLRPGDALSFKGARLCYTAPHDIACLTDGASLGGFVMLMNFSTTQSSIKAGCAVLVGPGIALCASHVVAGYRVAFRQGQVNIECIGTSSHGQIAWRVRRMRFVPNTDLCILSLSFERGLPPDLILQYASITTRVPRRGERLNIVAFMADISESKPIALIVSSGPVSDVYLTGRDRAMMPGACLHMESVSWSGMSGGPVFDSDGWLVGILSSSLDQGDGGTPSVVSLAIPGLTCPFMGGWPDPGPDKKRSLLEMHKSCMTTIERPESINVSYPDEGRTVSYVYTTWHDR